MILAATVAAGALLAQTTSMDKLGEQYVRLVLALGEHDPDYVDAYYGPPAWRREIEQAKMSRPLIESQAQVLARQLSMLGARGDEMSRLRHQYVSRQLDALRARLRMLSGQKLSFDEESKALYDAVAPVHTEAEFDAVLGQLAAKLPGDGSLIDRYDRFKQGFVIPAARLDRVFQEAIRACRRA